MATLKRVLNVPLLIDDSGNLLGYTDSAGVDRTLGGAAIDAGTVPAVGQFLAGSGTAAAPAYSFLNDSNSGIYRITEDQFGVSLGGVGRARFTIDAFDLLSTSSLNWSSDGADITALRDLRLFRDTANTLAQRNGTAAQAFRLYNTFTDASNYERGFLRWAANALEIGTESAGTGIARNLLIVSAGTLMNLYTSGSNRLELGTDYFANTTVGTVRLGFPNVGWKQFFLDYTNTATVGAVTINKAAGRVNIDAAGTSVVVTNSLVTAASKVFAVVSQADATAIVRNVVPAAGSFTITLNTAATAQVSIDFFVINAD